MGIQQIIDLQADHIDSSVKNQMLKVTMSQNETDKEMKIQKLNAEIDGLKDEMNTIKFENENALFEASNNALFNSSGKQYKQKFCQPKAADQSKFLSLKNKNSKVTMMLQNDIDKEIKIQNLKEENDELIYEMQTIKIQNEAYKLNEMHYCQQIFDLKANQSSLFLENKNLKLKMSQNETDNEIKIENLKNEIEACKDEKKLIETENELLTQNEKYYCQQIDQQKANYNTLFLENKNLKIKMKQNNLDKEMKIQNLNDEASALKEEVKLLWLMLDGMQINKK